MSRIMMGILAAFAVLSAGAGESRLVAGSIDAMGMNGVGLAEGPNAIGFRAVALLPSHGRVDDRFLFGNLLRLGPYDPDGGYSSTEWAVPLAASAVRRALRLELYGENAIPVPDYAEGEAARMRLEWTFDGRDAVARVSSDRAVEALLLFNGNVAPATVERGDAASAVLVQDGFSVAFAWAGEVLGDFVTGGDLAALESPGRGLCAGRNGRDRCGAIRVRVTPERPVLVALAPGRTAKVDAAETARRLKDGERNLATRTMTSVGSAAGCADALERLIGFSAIYDPRIGRRFLPTNRDWSQPNGYAPTFMWDNFFASYLACAAHPGLAKESLSHIIGIIAEKGMAKAPPQRNLIVPVIYSKFVRFVGDADFTRRTFPAMMSYMRFWFEDRGDGHPWRDGNDDGLIESGSCLRPSEAEPGRIVSDAFDETGYDDNPQYSAGFGHKRWGVPADGIRYDFGRGTLNLTLVGQNCLYVTACRAMAVVADEIGSAADAAWLRGEADRVAKRIRERLYDSESGIFLNRFFDGRFQGVLTHDTFTPLAAGVADESVAARLKAILTDPKKFWGENPVPTVSYDDPSFGDCTRPDADGYWKGNYWRGNVWPSTDYIVYTALRATDWRDVRREYVRRCRRMFMDDWEAHHHANENYPPFGATHASHMFAGNGGRDAHYIWSGLLPQQTLEELFSVEDTAAGIRFGAADPEGFGSWGNFTYRGEKGAVSVSAEGVWLTLGEGFALETSRPMAFRRFVRKGSGWSAEVLAPSGGTVRVKTPSGDSSVDLPPSDRWDPVSVR